MTPNQTIDLLTLIATFDQRTVGQADVAAWHTIATECGWTWPLARRAVLEHHKRDGDRPRIKPAHITDALDKARADIRKQVFKRDLVPPKELNGDVRLELAWRKELIADITERALAAWADGTPLPELEAPKPADDDAVEFKPEDLVGRTFSMPRADP